MTTNNPTPRPWIAPNLSTIYSREGAVVATGIAPADVAMIVRAVNSFDAMREALRVIVREFDAGRTPLARDVTAARAALALADGEGD